MAGASHAIECRGAAATATSTSGESLGRRPLDAFDLRFFSQVSRKVRPTRIPALTLRLLAYSRRQPLDPKPVRANALIPSMEDRLRRTLGERISLEMVLAAGLWATRCDPNQRESAILILARVRAIIEDA